jgi:hypothetical protein
VVSCVDSVDGAGEGACEDTGTTSARGGHGALAKNVLADGLVVSLAAKKAVYDHNWVALCLSVVVVKLVGKVNNPQAGRSVKRARPCRQRDRVGCLYPCRVLRGPERRGERAYTAVYGVHRVFMDPVPRSRFRNFFFW